MYSFTPELSTCTTRAQTSWTAFATGMSQGRERLTAASLHSHGLVFFAGGCLCGSCGHGCYSRVVDVYNASSNTWTAFATGLSVGHFTLTAASLPSHGLVFFAGGWSPGDSCVVDMYNANSNTWSAFATGLSQGRQGLVAAVLPLQELVFFAGGSSGSSFSRVVDVYSSSFFPYLSCWQCNHRRNNFEPECLLCLPYWLFCSG